MDASIILERRCIQHCGNDKGIKVMSLTMKICERGFYRRFRKKTSVWELSSLVSHALLLLLLLAFNTLMKHRYSPLATIYPYIVNLAIMIRTRFFDGFGFP